MDANSATPATSASCTGDVSAKTLSKRLTCGRQVGRRNEDAEALAPDHHARVILKIETAGNGVALAALERPQAAEIDIHQVLDVGRIADARLGHEQHVKRRPRTDFEIVFQKDRALVDADLAASPM